MLAILTAPLLTTCSTVVRVVVSVVAVVAVAVSVDELVPVVVCGVVLLVPVELVSVVTVTEVELVSVMVCGVEELEVPVPVLTGVTSTGTHLPQLALFPLSVPV